MLCPRAVCRLCSLLVCCTATIAVDMSFTDPIHTCCRDSSASAAVRSSPSAAVSDAAQRHGRRRHSTGGVPSGMMIMYYSETSCMTGDQNLHRASPQTGIPWPSRVPSVIHTEISQMLLCSSFVASRSQRCRM
jgi:hypothetical protein